jgi:phosphatidylglycerophosphate synthase
MLDTNGRQKIQPFFDEIAKWFIKVNMSANQVTLLALIMGLVPSLLLFGTNLIVLPVVILWISGVFDAVDGTVARLSRKSTYFGTIMDITFDRVVEIGLILGLAYRHEAYVFLFLLLACSIIVSMTIFLTVAAASEKSSIKSFYYQPGLAERTEGFIMFSLMILFETYILYFLIVFIVMILITAMQRFKEAYKYFGK